MADFLYLLNPARTRGARGRGPGPTVRPLRRRWFSFNQSLFAIEFSVAGHNVTMNNYSH